MKTEVFTDSLKCSLPRSLVRRKLLTPYKLIRAAVFVLVWYVDV